MEKPLKNLRIALNISQQEMAENLGCNIRTYRGYEYETRGLSPEILLLLNKKFNVNINWLITGTGNMFINSKENTLEKQNDTLVNKKISTLGLRLSEIQEKNNYQNKDMAELLGIYEYEYIGLKQGKKTPTLEILNNLKKYFKISVDWLLYGD